jgi:hypothetical protein
MRATVITFLIVSIATKFLRLKFDSGTDKKLWVCDVIDTRLNALAACYIWIYWYFDTADKRIAVSLCALYSNKRRKSVFWTNNHALNQTLSTAMTTRRLAPRYFSSSPHMHRLPATSRPSLHKSVTLPQANCTHVCVLITHSCPLSKHHASYFEYSFELLKRILPHKGNCIIKIVKFREVTDYLYDTVTWW